MNVINSPRSAYQNCDTCKRHYPSELMVMKLCPLCTLRWRNHIQQLPEDTPYRGRMSSEMYAAAVAFDKKLKRKTESA